MKYLATTAFVFLALFVSAQYLNTLNEVNHSDTSGAGPSIIYGNFVQRLGFSSGGFAQDIRIINTNTRAVYTFRVKPTFRSTKENTFVYFLKPGNYAILNYWWTESKWYGGKEFVEPIFKNIDATDNLANKIESGEIKSEDLVQFKFTIAENTITYLGTWHFDKGLVSFTDDKVEFDKTIKGKFKRLNLAEAAVVIPN